MSCLQYQYLFSIASSLVLFRRFKAALRNETSSLGLPIYKERFVTAHLANVDENKK